MIRIAANLSYERLREGREPKGVVVMINESWQEVLLEVRVMNLGRRAIEVRGLATLLPNGKQGLLIRPSGYPCVLAPNTSITSRIQKGWLDQLDAAAFGVLDLSNGFYALDQPTFEELLHSSRQLPPDAKAFVQSSDELSTIGFLAKDEGEILHFESPLMQYPAPIDEKCQHREQ